MSQPIIYNSSYRVHHRLSNQGKKKFEQLKCCNTTKTQAAINPPSLVSRWGMSLVVLTGVDWWARQPVDRKVRVSSVYLSVTVLFRYDIHCF